MRISKHKVAIIDYTLTDPEGEVLDTSQGRGPLAYIHGAGNIIPGLEIALEGKTAGEQLVVAIAPAQAYGERDDDLVYSVPRDRFEDTDELEVGMRFQTQTESGARVFTVVEIQDEEVTLDANHPLAGITLNFDVRIVNVREATPEELSHGHVHGPEGHDH